MPEENAIASGLGLTGRLGPDPMHGKWKIFMVYINDSRPANEKCQHVLVWLAPPKSSRFWGRQSSTRCQSRSPSNCGNTWRFGPGEFTPTPTPSSSCRPTPETPAAPPEISTHLRRSADSTEKNFNYNCLSLGSNKKYCSYVGFYHEN